MELEHKENFGIFRIKCHFNKLRISLDLVCLNVTNHSLLTQSEIACVTLLTT